MIEKEVFVNLLDQYLHFFPEEKDRQIIFSKYLNEHKTEEITDWNNFDGNVVVGTFIYAKREKKFLCLYHKDLEMFLYPGGHIDSNDNTILEAAKREAFEETGLENLEQFVLSNNIYVPIDIDTHVISYNERLDLPSHSHFEFRYLFLIDEIRDIQIEKNEHADYKWVDIKELEADKNFGTIASKLRNFLKDDTDE